MRGEAREAISVGVPESAEDGRRSLPRLTRSLALRLGDRLGLGGEAAPVARPGAGIALWIATTGAAVALHGSSRSAALVVCAAGALLTLGTLRSSLIARSLTALAIAPAALGATAPAWAWVVAGALLAVSVASRQAPATVRTHDLRRHIEWCRRRQEPAHVLVMRFLDTPAATARQVIETFRLTDSFTVLRRPGGGELHAVIDSQGFSKAGLERRLVDDVGISASFGWATFPDDGVTLDTLVDHARADLPAASSAQATVRSFVNAEPQSELV